MLKTEKKSSPAKEKEPFSLARHVGKMLLRWHPSEHPIPEQRLLLAVIEDGIVGEFVAAKKDPTHEFCGGERFRRWFDVYCRAVDLDPDFVLKALHGARVVLASLSEREMLRIKRA